MRSANSRSFITLLSLLLVVILGVGTSAFAQGKGKGGGGGNKGGGGQQRGGGGGGQHRGGPPQAQGQQKHAQRQQHPQMQRQHPQMQRQVQAKRPQWAMPQMQRPVQAQRQHPKFEKRQPEFARPQQQRQQIWAGNADRGHGRAKQEDRGKRNFNRQDIARDDRVRQRGDLNWQNYGRKDRSLRAAQTVPSWNNEYYKNYGQQRRAEVHARNAERKAAKSGSRSIGGYFTADDQYWYRTRVLNRDRDSWRDNILRTVIGSVFANSTSGYYYEPQYYNSYYTPSYNVGDGYYNDYPRYYSSYGPTPYYDFYSPYYADSSYSYGYSPAYYGSEPYYPYYVDNYVDDLGLPYLSTSSSFGGFVGRLFSELIALGYNQGYQDAMNVRSRGLSTRYYEDPYDPYVYTEDVTVFEDIGYNPYSCFGQSRLYVSEGYELGYRDALYGNNDYDPYEVGTNVDLVSVLISTVASLS